MTTIQKIIKIGSSNGVTLPAKQLRRLGIGVDDEVRVTIEAIHTKEAEGVQLPEEYKAFVEQYDETLKNLSDR